MDRVEPNSANDYSDRTTAAVKSVLVELGQVLGSFEGKFAVIGGAVPWLLLNTTEMPHVGTADVDLALHAEALGDGEYARLVEMLQRQGYRQEPDLRRFQLARTVPANDGGMPDGGRNRVSIAVAEIPALLAMKGYAIAKRQKPKDAYDIYYCVRNYPGGVDGLVSATTPCLKVEAARMGYRSIANKFRTVNDYGPICVRGFVADSPLLEQMTPNQWQQDAFGQVRAWLAGLGLS